MKDGITLTVEIFRCNGKIEAVIGDPNHPTALRGQGAEIPAALSMLALDAQAHPNTLEMHLHVAERENGHENA